MFGWSVQRIESENAQQSAWPESEFNKMMQAQDGLPPRVHAVQVHTCSKHGTAFNLLALASLQDVLCTTVQYTVPTVLSAGRAQSVDSCIETAGRQCLLPCSPGCRTTCQQQQTLFVRRPRRGSETISDAGDQLPSRIGHRGVAGHDEGLLVDDDPRSLLASATLASSGVVQSQVDDSVIMME
jgi:hypothetical protein